MSEHLCACVCKWVCECKRVKKRENESDRSKNFSRYVIVKERESEWVNEVDRQQSLMQIEMTVTSYNFLKLEVNRPYYDEYSVPAGI